MLYLSSWMNLLPVSYTHLDVYKRQGMARVSFSRGEVLAVLVSAAPLPHRRELVALLRERVPGLVGVVENRNDRRTNAILGRDNEVLWGKGTLTEELMGLTFQLSLIHI